ncbi:MAG: ABC transporter ATP-binding protein [Clostridia bacterium]|nr:ABC transporter ATP-binding protein [Clostridia bacterium]
MRKLLKYFKKYSFECVMSPLLKLFEVLLELAVPMIISMIVDKGIASKDVPLIARYTIFLALAGALGLAFSLSAQYFAAKASTGFVKDLRHSLFDHIEKLDSKYSDKAGTSFLLNIMSNDMQQLQTGANLFLRLLLRSPFVVFGAAIMAFTIDGKLALIFVAAIFILAAIIFTIMLVTMKYHKTVKERSDALLKTTRENLSGTRVIRAFCKEDQQKNKFDSQAEDVKRSQEKTNGIASLLNPITFVIINIALFVLLTFSSKKVPGILSPGQVIALSNYLSQILVELIKLANLIINISKSITCGNRIQSVFELPEETYTDNKCEFVDNSDDAVVFDNVTLNYTGTGEASLVKADFKLKRGQMTAVIGASGSGKTTLVNLLTGFYRPTEGNVFVDGCDITLIPNNVLRSKVKTVLQETMLFKGTVRENLLRGSETATDDDMIRALKDAQAYDFINEKGGLDFKLSQYGRNLSGGQRQRLSIARALVANPNILILDDSFSALDFTTEAQLMSAIKQRSGMTVLLITQRISVLRSVDKILVTDDGHIAGDGTFEELKGSCGVFREIYNSQVKEGRGL